MSENSVTWIFIYKTEIHQVFPLYDNKHISKDSIPLPISNDSSVQFSYSAVSDSVTPWTAACQASLSITSCRSSPKLMSIESGMPYNHLILCRPLLLLPPIPSSIWVFSNESTLCIRWPNYWSFSFNISPSNEHPGRISFRMDWLALLAVQGTLKSLLQNHSLNVSLIFASCLENTSLLMTKQSFNFQGME